MAAFQTHVGEAIVTQEKTGVICVTVLLVILETIAGKDDSSGMELTTLFSMKNEHGKMPELIVRVEV